MRKRKYLDRISFMLSSVQNGGLGFGTFRSIFEMSVLALAETNELSMDLIQRGKALSKEITREAYAEPHSEMNRIRLLREVSAWLTEAVIGPDNPAPQRTGRGGGGWGGAGTETGVGHHRRSAAARRCIP